MASSRRGQKSPSANVNGCNGLDTGNSSNDTCRTSTNGAATMQPNGPASSSTADKLKIKYRLEDLVITSALGTGTFGRVVLVKHIHTTEYFALKILAISEVIKLKQVDHVKSEKDILSTVRHPFIVTMLWADHDNKYLYMLLEYLCGGELFTYLRNAGTFSETMCLFYSAEIVSALDYLHSLAIVYRDLKPENLLLDKDGHLKLTDFGFAKRLDDRTWTLCGTPEYLAPEVVQNKGHNKAVDWWALGILIFEMLSGFPPFYDDNPFNIYDKILSGQIEWVRHMDTIAKDLIRKLLVQDRTKRLGNMKNGAEDVKNHRWFRSINWDDVYNKRLEPPIVPRVRHTGDARNFYEYPEQDWQKWYEDGQNSTNHDADSVNADKSKPTDNISALVQKGPEPLQKGPEPLQKGPEPAAEIVYDKRVFDDF